MKLRIAAFIVSTFLLVISARTTSADSPGGTISAGSGTGQPGEGGIPVSIRLSSQTGTDISGLNFDLSFDDSQLSVQNVTLGSAASGAGKSLSYSSQSSNRIRILIFGLNRSPIGNGSIATIIFNVRSSAPAGTSSLNLSNGAASSPDGKSVALNLSSGSFTVAALPPTATSTRASTNTPAPSSTSIPTSELSPTNTIPSDPKSIPSATHTKTNTPSEAANRTPTPTPSKTSNQFIQSSSTPTSVKILQATTPSTEYISPTLASRVPSQTSSQEAGGTRTPQETKVAHLHQAGGEENPGLEKAVVLTGTAIANTESHVASTATQLALSSNKQNPSNRPPLALLEIFRDTYNQHPIIVLLTLGVALICIVIATYTFSKIILEMLD